MCYPVEFVMVITDPKEIAQEKKQSLDVLSEGHLSTTEW